MSEEQDEEQKTEEATPHRLDQLREQGRAPRSADLAATAALGSALIALVALAGHASDTASLFTRRALSLRDAPAPLRILEDLVWAFASTALPIVLLVATATLVIDLVQGGGRISWTEPAPKLERLDPIAGLRRVLPTTDTLLEVGKTLLKVGGIGFVVYRVVDSSLPRLALLARSTAEVGAGETCAILVRLAVHATVTLGLVAALDWLLAWRKFHRDARMTKQEVKDEHKQQDGDPAIKAKRRARARALAKQRAIGEVKSATVLVTNPTHLAIALRYEPGRDAAPIVLAKGEEEVALRMRDEARRHRVPIVENRPLARAMYATAKVGRPIPVELYEAVAAVIAHVLRIRAATGR